MHARPAARLVDFANKNKEAVIWFTKDGTKTKCEGIMNLMYSGWKEGDSLTIEIKGSGDTQIADELKQLLEEIL
jgi:phosphotransferase system HPr (HPr) family protein